MTRCGCFWVWVALSLLKKNFEKKRSAVAPVDPRFFQQLQERMKETQNKDVVKGKICT